jgi:hypothetical protein
MVEDKSKPNPTKVFQVIADIISDREGVKVTVKGVRLKGEQQTA